jgi:hypothetical protein
VRWRRGLEWFRRTRSVAVWGTFPLVLVGCAVEPPQRTLQQPAVALSVIGNRPVADGRPAFRSVFCQFVRSGEPGEPAGPCDEFLWRLPDEEPAPALPVLEKAEDSRLRVLIVGGAFGDCYPPASTPFAQSVDRLRSRGVSIEYVAVSGRSSTALNSKTIADRVLAEPSDESRPIVLIGYSKGAADILETLTSHPEAAARVSAVVSVAGAVNGSPLASRYLGLYDRFLSKVAIGSCPPGDGGVVDSLSRSTRLKWLAENSKKLPHIRYYSVGTFTTPSRLARILAYPQRQLSRIDYRNDGQLLVQDQLIPGSKLLGYANADHWSVALQMEDRFPYLAHRSVGKHPFPQRALLESILSFVEHDLYQPDVDR